MNQQVAKDVGGSLYFDPTEAGRPSAATVTLRDSSGNSLQVATAATIDVVNSTLSALAAEGASSVVLASVAGIVRGRTYQMSDSEHFSVWRRVRAVHAVTKVVTFDEPLGFALASGSTFVGSRLTYTATPTHAADVQLGCEAIWAYTIAGVAYVGRSFWDIVRSVIPAVILRPDELRRYVGARAAAVRQRIEAQGDDLEDAIELAHEGVFADIRQKELDPTIIKAWEAFRKPIAFRLLLDRASQAEGIPQAYLNNVVEWQELRQREYTEALGEALLTCGVYDLNNDGTVTSSERQSRVGTVWASR